MPAKIKALRKLDVEGMLEGSEDNGLYDEANVSRLLTMIRLNPTVKTIVDVMRNDVMLPTCGFIYCQHPL